MYSLIQNLYIFLIVLFGLFNSNKANYECHSCLKTCTIIDDKLDPKTCDCIFDNSSWSSSNSTTTTTCSAPNCYVKIELFPDEATAVIQKGCVEGLSSKVDGCHYAGQRESIHCYCNGTFCNTVEKLNSYVPKSLPIMECCECSQPGGDNCSIEKCQRKCRGNYCLIDFDGIEQGCGLGLPRLQTFLRVPDYIQLFQGDTTCARYQATPSTSVHGCVCSHPSGPCNGVNATRHYQLENVVLRRQNDQNYCFSLHEKSNKLFDKTIFEKSDTCEGHYCFVSMTTSELILESRNTTNSDSPIDYLGVMKPSYEILAGCLKVDDDKKISLGCTVEYNTNMNSSTTTTNSSHQAISRHCICDTHTCNFFNLINTPFGYGETIENIEQEIPPPTAILLDDDDETPPPSNNNNNNSIYIKQNFILLALLIIYFFKN